MEQELLAYIRANPNLNTRQLAEGLGRPGAVAFSNALRALRRDGLVVPVRATDENGNRINLYRVA